MSSYGTFNMDYTPLMCPMTQPSMGYFRELLNLAA